MARHGVIGDFSHSQYIRNAWAAIQLAWKGWAYVYDCIAVRISTYTARKGSRSNKMQPLYYHLDDRVGPLPVNLRLDEPDGHPSSNDQSPPNNPQGGDPSSSDEPPPPDPQALEKNTSSESYFTLSLHCGNTSARRRATPFGSSQPEIESGVRRSRSRRRAAQAVVRLVPRQSESRLTCDRGRRDRRSDRLQISPPTRLVIWPDGAQTRTGDDHYTRHTNSWA